LGILAHERSHRDQSLSEVPEDQGSQMPGLSREQTV
jgi:hypothetical protein